MRRSDESASTKLLSSTGFQFIDQRELEKDRRVLSLVRSHVLRNTSLKKKRLNTLPKAEKTRHLMAKAICNGQDNLFLVNPNKTKSVLIGGHDKVGQASGDLGKLYSCKPLISFTCLK
jgi:hypothetical protein